MPICRIPNEVPALDEHWKGRLSQLVARKYAEIRTAVGDLGTQKADAWLERNPVSVVVDLEDATAKWSKIQARLGGEAIVKAPADAPPAHEEDLVYVNKLRTMRRLLRHDHVLLHTAEQRTAYERVVLDYLASIAIRAVQQVRVREQDVAGVVNSVAYSVWDRINETDFQEKDNLDDYVFRTGRNAAVDHLRRESKHDKFRVAVGLDDVPGTSGFPEEAAIAEEASHAVREALLQLPDRVRIVVELRLAGLTFEEIGERLGYPHSASLRSLFHRARQHLAHLLDRRGV